MRVSCLLLLFTICINLFAQSPPSDSTAEAFAAFPEAYAGKWAGELDIFSARGKVQSVPMQLHIIPVNDTTFTYTIYYGENLETGKRDYLLRKGQKGNHHWIIDEQDGILLDNFYVGGVLHGPFTVAGSALNSSLERKGDQLLYSIISGPVEPFRASETTSIEDGKTTTYQVESFEVRNYQRAFLKRM